MSMADAAVNSVFSAIADALASGEKQLIEMVNLDGESGAAKLRS